MKLVLNRTIKCLMVIAFISSSMIMVAGSNKTYDGTVIEIAEEEDGAYKTSSYLKYPNAVGNWILWVIQPGVFVKQGTKLVHADTTYIDVNIKICKAKLAAQALILKYAKRDMERQHALQKTKSVSEKAKEDAEIAFYNAQINYELASQALQDANWDKIFADIPAPYDCYIDKVYTKPGTISDIDYPIMKIMRLSPLYIDVRLDRDLAKKIYDQKVGVSVYPMDSDKPVGVYNEKIIITDGGVRLPVTNYILDDFEDKSLPIIRDVGYVATFKSGDPSAITGDLGILDNSLYKDKDGKEYVWKAVGQKGLQPGKTIASSFPVEKIYINKTGKEREGFDGKLHEVTGTEKLQVNDILLHGASETLKDGEKVMYKKRACLFWPGDKVKVTLSE